MNRSSRLPEICHWHHERYDGGGYPDGAHRGEIPIAAQAAAIADVCGSFDWRAGLQKGVFTRNRPSDDQNGECGQFNPLLLECLNDISGTLRQEWKVDLLGREFRWKLENTVAELLRDNGLSASKRIIRLMEEERDKKAIFRFSDQGGSIRIYCHAVDDMLFRLGRRLSGAGQSGHGPRWK